MGGEPRSLQKKVLSGQQILEQLPVALLLFCEAEAVAGDQGAQLIERHIKVFIDNNKICFHVVAHFFAGFGNAAGDDRLFVLSPAVEALVQGFQRWRQNKNTYGFRHQMTNLGGALPVDFKDDIDTLVQRIFDPGAGCAVIIVKNLGPF